MRILSILTILFLLVSCGNSINKKSSSALTECPADYLEHYDWVNGQIDYFKNYYGCLTHGNYCSDANYVYLRDEVINDLRETHPYQDSCKDDQGNTIGNNDFNPVVEQINSILNAE